MRMTRERLERHLRSLRELELDLEQHRDTCEELSSGYHWAQDGVALVRELMSYLGVRNPEPDKETH